MLNHLLKLAQNFLSAHSTQGTGDTKEIKAETGEDSSEVLKITREGTFWEAAPVTMYSRLLLFPIKINNKRENGFSMPCASQVCSLTLQQGLLLSPYLWPVLGDTLLCSWEWRGPLSQEVGKWAVHRWPRAHHRAPCLGLVTIAIWLLKWPWVTELDLPPVRPESLAAYWFVWDTVIGGR